MPDNSPTISATLPLTIPALHQAYASGTPVSEVVAQIYARIAAVADPGIFITLAPKDTVLAAAAALGAFDPAKPLWGIPFAVKDNIDVAGFPTTAACPAYAYDAKEDAFVVALLKAAGALCIGKTNLDQFATGLVGLRTPYGAPLNAMDPAIVPGGSSGGSGVAVSHGIVTFALGTDTAGSGRVPAALNNIVGLKPTLGALSARGVVPACRSIETVSVLALTVDDAYRAYQVCSAYDPIDAYALDWAAPDIPLRPPVLRIGVPSTSSIRFFGDTVQAASFSASVDLLRNAGAIVAEIDFEPFYAVASMLYDGAWVAERYTVIADLLASDPDAILPVTRQIIGKAETLTAADAFRGIYRLKELARAAEQNLEGLDMLCVPTIPTFYTVQDLLDDPITPNANLGTYTNFVNLLNLCGLAIPTPPRSDGRPGSVTLLAKAGQDHLLAATASLLEAAGDRRLGATPWAYPAPPQRNRAPTDAIIIAVCGAHMSGLPLNRDLTSCGATFVESTCTSSAYSLYALAGEPPLRPGLVRGVAASGKQITVELWSIPRVAFGGFMQTIPSPLCIGTVALADGRNVYGFICEGEGLNGAVDISSSGGWRAHLQKQN